MSKRALYSVVVNGQDITSTLSPILTAASISLQSGDEADTAAITLDDTGGLIDMPETGATIQIALGWAGQGLRIVFDGTVDETVSTGSRGGGMALAIAAKGFAAEGAAKDRRRRHWDNATAQKILGDAAKAAGVSSVRVDPDLAQIKLTYWAMDDESFLAMGRRLARRIGGVFQVQGDVAQMAKKGASYAPTVTATRGANLHDWTLAPVLGRAIYGKIIAPFFDRNAGTWDQIEVTTGLGGDAVLKISPPANDRDDARRQARAKAEECKRASGGGYLTIEGSTDAIPDGACIVVGARPGIDRSYRIIGVDHTIDRGGGWITRLRLGHPESSTG